MHYTSTTRTHSKTWQIVTKLAEDPPTGRGNQINDMNFLFKDINARSASCIRTEMPMGLLKTDGIRTYIHKKYLKNSLFKNALKEYFLYIIEERT